jgi:hypothetical protein
MSKKVIKKKGLTDKQLAEKYDTGGKVNFEKAIKHMSKAPSKTALSKPKRKK